MPSEQEALLHKAQAIAAKGGNNICAECPERHPVWVSFLQPVFPAGETLAVFVCNKCYKHHFDLGSTIVKQVKTIDLDLIQCQWPGTSTEWSRAEIKTLDTTGNVFVNDIYEANMDDLDNDKDFVTFDKEAERKARNGFVINKYRKRQYFNEDFYHSVMLKLNKKYDKHAKPMEKKEETKADTPNGAIILPETPRVTRRGKVGMYSTKTPATPSSKPLAQESEIEAKEHALQQDPWAIAATPTKRSSGGRQMPQSPHARALLGLPNTSMMELQKTPSQRRMHGRSSSLRSMTEQNTPTPKASLLVDRNDDDDDDDDDDTERNLHAQACKEVARSMAKSPAGCSRRSMMSKSQSVRGFRSSDTTRPHLPLLEDASGRSKSTTRGRGDHHNHHNHESETTKRQPRRSSKQRSLSRDEAPATPSKRRSHSKTNGLRLSNHGSDHSGGGSAERERGGDRDKRRGMRKQGLPARQKSHDHNPRGERGPAHVWKKQSNLRKTQSARCLVVESDSERSHSDDEDEEEDPSEQEDEKPDHVWGKVPAPPAGLSKRTSGGRGPGGRGPGGRGLGRPGMVKNSTRHRSMRHLPASNGLMDDSSNGGKSMMKDSSDKNSTPRDSKTKQPDRRMTTATSNSGGRKRPSMSKFGRSKSVSTLDTKDLSDDSDNEESKESRYANLTDSVRKSSGALGLLISGDVPESVLKVHSEEKERRGEGGGSGSRKSSSEGGSKRSSLSGRASMERNSSTKGLANVTKSPGRRKSSSRPGLGMKSKSVGGALGLLAIQSEPEKIDLSVDLKGFDKKIQGLLTKESSPTSSKDHPNAKESSSNTPVLDFESESYKNAMVNQWLQSTA